MQRKLLGFCAILLFATFGMLSGAAQAHYDESSASSETITLQGDGLQRQEMSNEEKERRREECARVFDACFDWCIKTTPKPQDAPRRGQCIQDCKDKNTECMKKIPSNPTEDPDY
jgi:hypothetical protein